MVKPERRTRADLVAAGVIGLVVAVVAGVIWWTSDARATQSNPAAVTAKPLVPAKEVPNTLRELWSAPSAHTTVPVVAGGSVVTGDGHTVAGHDPVTGAVNWTYTRDLELCGVSWIYQSAVAVYPDRRGCGQVTTIDASTGERGPTRSGYADKQVVLSSDGTTVLAAGSTRLETWRSDMVRVIAFGEIDSRFKPNQTPVGKGCDLLSAAASTTAVSVLRACPDRPEVTLTLLKPSKQDDEPDVRDVPLPGVTAGDGTRVLAVSDLSTAVYQAKPSPHVIVIDETGTEVSNTPLATAPTAAGLRPGATTPAGGLVTWWTGDSVVVFDSDKLTYRYTIAANGPAVPLGPAAMMANKLLVPVTGGVGVYQSSTGIAERVIAVQRPAVDGPIVPTPAGDTLIEQRGPTLVALG